MSVCVTVRTKKIPAPDVYIKYLVEQGEAIMITSNDYPSVKFGNIDEAIRGIEVNKEEDGLEVRICSFSSKEDYRLFAKTIDALMKITGGKAFLENADEDEITDPFETFHEEWIKNEVKSAFNIVRVLIGHNGHQVVMFGLFCKFCLGACFFQNFDIPMKGDIDKEVMNRFMDYLCMMQWRCADLKDTSTRMVVPAPDGDSEKCLTISMIVIEEGKVRDFDYISEANLLGILDTDDDSLPPVLIPFKEAWKILPDDIFYPLDDLQFMRKNVLSVEAVHKMMNKARCLQPDNLHYKPTYPGSGFDERQNTFILMWNPDISSMTLENHQNHIENLLTDYFNWSVWEHEKAKLGDRFFLVRVGEGKTGIVMSGIFDSHPYEAGDWSGKGRQVFYMDMLPNVILDPENVPMLTTEELQNAIPSFEWSGGHSGRVLSIDEAKILESLWEQYLAENTQYVDGKYMNVLNL